MQPPHSFKRFFLKDNSGNAYINTIILVGILVIACILRFFNLFEIPYTHDEFSALFRTEYNNFSELIEKGVKPDGHPPGVQVFLFYWTKLFGYTEWVVKLPFILCGVFSVFLIYIIGKIWFNKTVGLLSSAFLSSIQYTIMYSQIARPYGSGIFLTLAMVYFWTMLIKRPEKQFIKNSIFYIVFSSLCSYNHHFSLLFAAIIGISGLFFIKKKYLFKYLLNTLIIVVLYIPNIPILLHQLSLGGIEGWLGKPNNTFIIDYLRYIFQFSYFTYFLVFGIIIYGFINRGKINFKNFTLFFSLFFLPFLIGFVYSKFFNSVIQYSVLIFSFPFLFYVLFGHIKEQKAVVNAVLVFIILCSNIYALVYGRQHYKIFYTSHIQKIVEDHEDIHYKYKNTTSIIDSYERISLYYWSKLATKTPAIWFNTFESKKDFSLFVEEKSLNNDYFYLGCTSENLPTTVPIIQDYFPTIEQQHNYASGTTYLFSKKANNNQKDIVGKFVNNTPYHHWVASNDSNKTVHFIDSLTEWGPTFSFKLKDIISNKNNFIDISVKALVNNTHEDIFVVSSLESGNKTIYWSATPFSDFIEENDFGRWTKVYHSLKLSDIPLKRMNINLKVFIWNQKGQSFYIDDFEVKRREGNPIIYSILDDF